MAYDSTGKWTPEDDSVSSRVAGLINTDSPLMDAARTNAKTAANKRGLMNSSMAAGAGTQAALSVATPIASQEASQIAQKNLAAQTSKSQENIAAMNVAAHDRQYAMANATEMNKTYGAMFSEILKNNDLPKDARDKYYQHIASLHDSDMSLVEQMYGIDLTWASPVATHG